MKVRSLFLVFILLEVKIPNVREMYPQKNMIYFIIHKIHSINIWVYHLEGTMGHALKVLSTDQIKYNCHTCNYNVP